MATLGGIGSNMKSAAFRLLRAGRVVAISFGIFQCGKQAGVSEVINDPAGTQRNLLKMMFIQQGATGESKDVAMKRKSRVVGKRIIVSCKEYCLEKYISAKNECTLNDRRIADDEEVRKWAQALQLLRGHEWSFFVINAPTVNAFVHHLLPGKVFIHEGLFTHLKPTDDELAMILSHELAHVIHQHGQARSDLTLGISIMQLVLFTFVDPSGVLPFIFDIALNYMGTGLTNFYSRENETEADLTGVEIAAHACFETREAHKVFGKLSDGDHYWNSTHPSGESRVAYMLEASGLYNPEALGDKCKKMKGFLEDVKKLLRPANS